MNTQQALIVHLIEDHLVAPWLVKNDAEAQHQRLHAQPCLHTHDDVTTVTVGCDNNGGNLTP